MPRVGKKKKACKAATVESQIAEAKRREKCGKALNDGRAQRTDENDENDELIPDKELVMGKDVFEQLKMSIMKDPEPGTFRYARGCQKSRQTIWRDKKQKKDLQEATTGTAVITQFFKSTVAEENVSESVSEPMPEPSSASLVTVQPSIDVQTTTLQSAIGTLKKLLRSNHLAPVGQNLMRHVAVLHFLQLQLKRPWETRAALSLSVSQSFGRGTTTARRLCQWERSWVLEQCIKVGLRGTTTAASSWLDDEGVSLAVREYNSSIGDKLTSGGLAQAVSR